MVEKSFLERQYIFNMGEDLIMRVRKMVYKGWENCVEIYNDAVNLIVTTDVGPRILRYGFLNQKNQFVELEEEGGTSGGNAFRLYGGHRLWHSPEDIHRTYVPDNESVTWHEDETGVVFVQKPEERVQVQKTLKVYLGPKGSEVSVWHGIKNVGAWPIELAPWTITMMAPGGKGVFPQPKIEAGLLPNRVLSLWPYTDLSDERLIFEKEHIFLLNDPLNYAPLKIGAHVAKGMAGYLHEDTLFTKTIKWDPKGNYPDHGVNFEMYTNHRYLEVEGLGPMRRIEVGEDAVLEEKWNILKFDGDPKTLSNLIV
jgi:hypothetical protein